MPDPRMRELIPTPDVLPNMLASHGWAPALHVDPTQTFWGDDLNNADTPPTGICGVMITSQVENGYCGEEGSLDTHPNIAAIIRAEEILDTTAERCFVSMMGPPNDTDFDPIDKVEGTAPPQINIYTVGCVRNPFPQVRGNCDLCGVPQGWECT